MESLLTSAVLAVLNPMIEQATTAAMQGCGSALGAGSEIAKLRQDLPLLDAMLRAAEEKQLADDNVCAWVRRLKCLGFDAYDVLDEFQTESASRALREGGGGLAACSISCFAGSLRAPFFRCAAARKIRDVRQRLVEAKADGEALKLVVDSDAVAAKAESAAFVSRPETTGIINRGKFALFGRDEIKEEIMARLLLPEAGDHEGGGGGVQLVPIIGMGGLGKTTLAKAIYNDGRLAGEYPAANRCWVTLGEKEFSARRTMEKVVRKEDSSSDSLQELQDKMVEKLSGGGRFLIVLDDIWSVGHGEWAEFWNPLTNVGGKGGAVVVTSRLEDLLEAAGHAGPVAGLKPLSDADCWSVFEKNAFPAEGTCSGFARQRLEAVGMRIVESLGGVPLAAEVVGRSLCRESNEAEWEKCLDALARKGGRDVTAALKWSYVRLPPHLKLCFAYCSVFPEDYAFEPAELVGMWMAQGLVQTQGRERPEDAGARYFKELLRSSFFQQREVDDDDDEDEVTYTMHDLIHDLSKLVARDEWLASTDLASPATDGVVGDEDPLGGVRHVSIVAGDYDDDEEDTERLKRLPRCRRLSTVFTSPGASTFYHRVAVPKEILRGILAEARRLRVLVLRNTSIQELPDCIGELKLLRYLDLRHSDLESLPDAACDLLNLQTLRVPFTTCLPSRLGGLINLRHLDAGVYLCKHGTQEKGYNGAEQLKGLAQLSGELRLHGLESLAGGEDAARAALKDKPNLEGLHLSWVGGGSTGVHGREAANDVLERLRPPPSLKRLEVQEYSGDRWAGWVAAEERLPRLVKLVLYWCQAVEALPQLGGLPHLRELFMESMDGVKRVGQEFYGAGRAGRQRRKGAVFPELEYLSFRFFQGLEEWAEPEAEAEEEEKGVAGAVPVLPRLRRLAIEACPKLTTIPARLLRDIPSLESVQVSRCPNLILAGEDDKNASSPSTTVAPPAAAAAAVI